MRRHETELRSRLGRRKLSRRVLRLLRAVTGFPVSSIGQEELACVVAPMAVNISHDSRREIRSALLNAERRKAEALEWHRRRLVC